MRLEGKTAVITGGGTGLGLATAKLFRREGARIAITGRRADVLARAAAEIGGDTVVCPGDMADEAQVATAFKVAVDALGRIDILVHSAGGNPERKNIAEATVAGFRQTFEQNTTSSFLVVQAALPAMPKGGAMVLIGSVAGITASQNRISYGTAKAAMIGMTRHLAYTLGPKGIRVNLVAPGMIRTDLTAPLLDAMPKAQLDQMMATYPIGHLGDPDDIAHACLYLASPEAKWVSGVVLPVDGGRVTH